MSALQMRDVKFMQMFWGMTLVPAQNKRPQLNSWKQYQTATTPPDNFDWTSAQQIGMVLQDGWLVLDIDTHDDADRFRRAYPQLWITTRERTPRGYHLYYRVGQGKANIRHGERGDILTAGAFVIIAPSAGYTLESTSTLTIDQNGIDAIQRWLSTECTTADSGSSRDPDGRDELASSTHCTTATPDELLDKFKRRAGAGRNNALFTTTIDARNAGMARSEVAVLLLPDFVAMTHGGESIDKRNAEGVATIKSAFKRDYTCINNRKMFLPTALREKLYKDGRAADARLLQAMLTAGYEPGQTITRRDAIQLDGIGHHTARRVLNEDNELFGFALRRGGQIVAPPSRTHPPVSYADAPTAYTGTKSNAFCTTPKSSLSHLSATRPEFVFVFTGIESICEALDVAANWFDYIPHLDINTSATWGAGALKALISRYEGVSLPQQWIAAALGRSQRTIQRWLARAGVFSVENWSSDRLTEFHLSEFDELRPNEKLKGYRIRAGKKLFPACYSVASFMLRNKRYARIEKRLPNSYYIADPSLINKAAIDAAADQPTRRPAAEPRRWWPTPDYNISTPAAAAPTTPQPQPATNPLAIWHKVINQTVAAAWSPGWSYGNTGIEGKTPSGRGRKDNIITDENTIKDLQAKLNMSIPPGLRISISNMRRLVRTHGAERVSQQIDLALDTAKVKNKVGYVVARLRG